MILENTNFDTILTCWYPDIYRFCFLLSCHGDAAREIAFQAFLYAGADSHFPVQEPEASIRLFSYAAKTCEDYYLRRMRRIPSRDVLSESVTFSIHDSLWSFLKLPTRQKAALFLHRNLAFSPQQVSQILHISLAKVNRLLSPAACESALSQEDCSSIVPDSETASQISDDLYMRFEDRNVRLENRLRNIRLSIDQSIPWIALAILGIFAAAALYTSGL